MPNRLQKQWACWSRAAHEQKQRIIKGQRHETGLPHDRYTSGCDPRPPRPYWNATKYDSRLPLDTHPHNLEHLEESCLTEWNGWSMEKFMKRLCELHGASFFWCKNGHDTWCGMHMCQHASTAQAASRHDHARISHPGQAGEANCVGANHTKKSYPWHANHWIRNQPIQYLLLELPHLTNSYIYIYNN